MTNSLAKKCAHNWRDKSDKLPKVKNEDKKNMYDDTLDIQDLLLKNKHWKLYSKTHRKLEESHFRVHFLPHQNLRHLPAQHTRNIVQLG